MWIKAATTRHGLGGCSELCGSICIGNAAEACLWRSGSGIPRVKDQGDRAWTTPLSWTSHLQPSRRRPLPHLHRYRAQARPVSPRHMAQARRDRAADHGLVRQRLPRHGPAPGGSGRDARGDGRHRRRLGRHAQHLRHDGLSQAARGRACRPARQGSGAALHLRLHRQRRDALDAAEAVPRPHHLFRRAEPRLDDRGRAPQRRGQADLPAQRRRASARAAGGRRSRRAQAHRVRIGLFDGRRFRPDRGDLRPGRRIRRADLYRRGACGRHVRPARRRRGRARPADAPASTSSTARWPRPTA